MILTVIRCLRLVLSNESIIEPKYEIFHTIYEIQMSLFWRDLLSLISWLYLLLTFIEPNYYGDTGYVDSTLARWYPTLTALESIAVSFFWLDMILFLIHKLHEHSLPLWRRVFNAELIIQFLFNCCVFTDLVVFHMNYPRILLRFSRPIRPSNEVSLMIMTEDLQCHY